MSQSCIVKYCPALRVAKSPFGYCSIHHMVVSSAEMFDQALKGKITATLKEFAQDCERGVYPRVAL